MGQPAVDRAVVFGAGALGSYIGAKLSLEIPVSLVGRKAHVDAIRDNGLWVYGIEKFRSEVDATETLGTIEPGTLVIVTVKLYDLESAAAEIAAALPPGCVVMPVMNGLNPEDAFREALGDETPVVRGIAMLGSTFEGPGEVSYWGGGMTLEPTAISDALSGLFERAGIRTSVAASPESYRDLVWRKFAVNHFNNPLTAILGVRNLNVVADELAPLRRRMIAECSAVASADGVTLPDNFIESTESSLSKSRNMSSMLQDVLRRPRTENEAIGGELLARARAAGIDCPATELAYDLVSFIESMDITERPAAIEAARASSPAGGNS